MKPLSLLMSALFAISLTGAVGATPAGAVTETINLTHCTPSAASGCELGTEQLGKLEANASLAAEPKPDPNQLPLDPAASPVPETHIIFMMVMGLGVVGLASRRRQRSEKFDN